MSMAARMKSGENAITAANIPNRKAGPTMQ